MSQKNLIHIKYAGDINPNQFESDVSIGEFSPPQSFEAVDLLLSELHGSVLHSRHFDWNQVQEDDIRICLLSMDQLSSQVQQMVSEDNAMQLAPLRESLVDDERAQGEMWNKLALDEETFSHISTLLETWCEQVCKVNVLIRRLCLVLNQSPQVEHILLERNVEGTGAGEGTVWLGPRTDVHWWNKRASKLSSIVAQLNSKEATIVFSVSTIGRAKVMKRWKDREKKLLEAFNDARHNVDLLTEVDAELEPLYSGSETQIMESLPRIMRAFRHLSGSSQKFAVSRQYFSTDSDSFISARETRYYKSRRRIEQFLTKTANQLVLACRRLLQNRGRLIDQEPAAAISGIQVSSELCAVFQRLVLLSKEKLVALSSSKAYDFDTDAICSNVKTFEGRLLKIQNLITTIQQVSAVHVISTL